MLLINVNVYPLSKFPWYYKFGYTSLDPEIQFLILILHYKTHSCTRCKLQLEDDIEMSSKNKNHPSSWIPDIWV